jgi:hypothetical protein
MHDGGREGLDVRGLLDGAWENRGRRGGDLGRREARDGEQVRESGLDGCAGSGGAAVVGCACGRGGDAEKQTEMVQLTGHAD